MKMLLTSYIWFCFVSVVLSGVSEVTVQSSFGEMTGLIDDAITLGSELRSGLRFLGIPYAKPPTGPRRFKKPEPESSLETTYNATFFRKFCPQTDVPIAALMDENCLHLNIFIPGNTISANNTYSVMIWIYGGGFQWGLADTYFGDVLSTFNDMIVVTLNYRLNIFGFLDDGSGTFSNNGLHDQKLAIDWVHNHIGSFGGDATKVTLFGESAGGASVMYQALNPENEGRFSRIITQSGSVLASWAYESNPRDMFNAYTAKMNCTRFYSNESLSCLRTKSVGDLISVFESTTWFVPTVDGQFLTTDPLSLFTNHTRETSESIRFFSNLDFLSGYNNKDGAGSMIVTWSSRLNESGISFDNGVPRHFFDTVYIPSVVNEIFGKDFVPAITTALIHEYVDWKDPHDSTKIRSSMVDIPTDNDFLVPAIIAAQVHARNSNENKTYLYRFSHKSKHISIAPSWVEGADHAEDIFYVFGISINVLLSTGLPPQVHELVPSIEIDLSKAMMTYWTNFAKTGNPNGLESTSTEYPIWQPYDVNIESYIDLTANLNTSAVKQHPAASKVNFWKNLVPVLNAAQCGSQTCDVCETSSALTSHISIILVPQLFIFLKVLT